MGLGIGLGVDLATCVTGGVAPPFIPTSLSGCVLWLRADLGFSAGSWVDQSPTGATFLQASSPAQPTLTSSSVNGQPGVTFAAGPQQNLVGPVSTAAWNLSAFTIYVVAKPTASFGAFTTILSKATSAGLSDGYGILSCGTANEMDCYSGAYTTFAKCGTVTLGTGAVYRGELAEPASAAISGYQNGSIGTSSTASEVDSAVGITLGKYDLAGGGQYSGDINEIVIFNRVLNSTELGQMSTYTTTRYALAA